MIRFSARDVAFSNTDEDEIPINDIREIGFPYLKAFTLLQGEESNAVKKSPCNMQINVVNPRFRG